MSLKDTYSMAHTAQCRLEMEASRPERNLRFVVGHLMHYESLRLRIVEIEHDISRSQQAKAVQFRGTGHVNHHLQHKVSTGQLRKRSPPPKPVVTFSDEEDEDPEEMIRDDEDDDDQELGLTRFPSGSARPPRQLPPELEADDWDDDDDDDDDQDEPVSPEEPDQATVEEALKGIGDESMAKMYNKIKKCPCHGKTHAPAFERVWELPGGEHDGKTLAVVQVSEEEVAA